MALKEDCMDEGGDSFGRGKVVLHDQDKLDNGGSKPFTQPASSLTVDDVVGIKFRLRGSSLSIIAARESAKAQDDRIVTRGPYIPTNVAIEPSEPQGESLWQSWKRLFRRKK